MPQINRLTDKEKKYTMKADLAPKNLFLYYLLTAGLGLIIVSIIHQSTMDIAMHSDNFVPFMTTTSVWCAFFLTILFILNKCRYVISTDENQFKVGNLLSHSQVTSDNIKVDNKVLLNLFKVTIENKRYYIFTSDKIISDFKKSKQ